MPADEVPLDSVIPCFACLCCMCNCFPKMPECIGCFHNDTCCCVEVEGQCCKPTSKATGGDEGECCVCQSSACKIVKPRTCCQAVDQCFCFDQRFALPPTGEDIMVAVGCFGIMCYPMVAVCKPAAFLKGKEIHPDGAPYAPDAPINATADDDDSDVAPALVPAPQAMVRSTDCV